MLDIMFKMLVKLSLLMVCFLTKLNGELDVDIDPNGYILYCPCVGRFGYQVGHFLGALSFAHGLGRTLVLPPWVEYHQNRSTPVLVPFKTYFRVEAVNEYHPVITMEDFMEELAPKLWPVGKRISFCYQARGSFSDTNPSERSCNAKVGSPFAPFWDNFNIDFDSSEIYGLDHNTEQEHVVKDWGSKYPPRTHPVLAFTVAPVAAAKFPVREIDLPLQKYVRWSPWYEYRALKYIAEDVERPFIAIHLMNSIDFQRVCELASPGRNLYASAQCLGFRNENGEVTKELCMPSESSVIDQLEKAVEKYKAKTVFIATDYNPMISQFQEAMESVKFVTEKFDPQLELAILGQADHFICNCVSAFSAFATRERRANNRSVEFWNFTPVNPETMYKL